MSEYDLAAAGRHAAATGFAAFEGAKPGRSTDLRGVVGDDDGAAAARWGDASGATSAADCLDRAPPGTCCWSQRVWGGAGRDGRGGGGGARPQAPAAAAAALSMNAAPRQQRLGLTGTTP